MLAIAHSISADGCSAPAAATPAAAHLPAGPPAGVGANVEMLECLTAQLPSLPDPSLFADVGSAPAEPNDATQAAAWAATTAAHLQLLAELAARLDAASLGLAALAAAGSSSNADAGPPGSLRIEELDAAAPTTRLPALLVLAAALYGGGDAQLQHLRPWADGPAAAAAQQLLEALASQLAAVLEQQRKQEVRQPSSQPGALLQEVVTTTTKAVAGPHQQSEAVQQLLALALPPALQQLRPVLAANVEHAKHKTARLEVYAGAWMHCNCNSLPCPAVVVQWAEHCTRGQREKAARPCITP